MPLPGPLVKWLRHRPFTAVTGVRLSHGSPKKKTPLVSSFFGMIFALRANAVACGSDVFAVRKRAAKMMCRAGRNVSSYRRNTSSGASATFPSRGRLDTAGAIGNIFANEPRQQGLSGGLRRVQNPRSRAEGVHSYVESKRTGRGKRKLNKKRKPVRQGERVSTLISV